MFCVLGAGSWGTALSLHLARKGYPVCLWGRDEQAMAQMATDRANVRYLPDQPFPSNLSVTSDLNQAYSRFDAPIILIALPSRAIEDVLLVHKQALSHAKGFVVATKGLTKSGQWLHDFFAKAFPLIPCAFISGPSFAKEVARSLPTAVCLATTDHEFGEKMQRLFHHANFRVYHHDDVVGLEVGGLIKNVLAIAVGLSDGMGYGANARAALITKGLAEIRRLGKVLGGKEATFTGLSGLGDLVLTATDDQSRNRRFGLALGKGLSPAQAFKEINQVVEGYSNSEVVVGLAKKHDIELPICEQAFLVIHGKISVKQAVQTLLERFPGVED